MSRFFVLSDIHGCAKTFKNLIFENIHLEKSDFLYLLGDYIDRGPDSKGVLDTVFYLIENGYRVEVLKGNHEQMLLNALEGGNDCESWIRNGGKETLQSFRVSSPNFIDKKYIDLIREMKYFLEIPGYILVHAGLNFNAKDPMEDLESMLWIRKMIVDYDFLKSRIIVHGHTPTPVDLIRENLRMLSEKGHLCIDNGCVIKQYEYYGHLACLELTTLQLTLQPCID